MNSSNYAIYINIYSIWIRARYFRLGKLYWFLAMLEMFSRELFNDRNAGGLPAPLWFFNGMFTPVRGNFTTHLSILL